MRKSLEKVALVVVIAGLLVGGIAIASAATKVRTVTTPQGTSVDVISVTGTVTEVSTTGVSKNATGFMGMLRRGPKGYAKVKDNADGTVYTLELECKEAAGIVLKVGDTVTVEGTSETRNSVNELNIWTFTGADGKTVTLRKADGSSNIETASVAGTVTEVDLQTTSAGPVPGGTTRPAPKAMATIKVKQADGTVLTVLLRDDESIITVKIGDTVKIEGFKTPVDTNTVMATSFTGADGTTVRLGGRGLGGCGMPPGNRGPGRGFRGGRMGPESAPDSLTRSET